VSYAVLAGPVAFLPSEPWLPGLAESRPAGAEVLGCCEASALHVHLICDVRYALELRCVVHGAFLCTHSL